MKLRVHAIAGTFAIILIAIFMTVTVVTELIGDEAQILVAKTAILYALVVLIPSVMIAGGSGRSIAGGWTSPALVRKKRRTAAVALIGLLVLVPCAFVLRILAADADFGPSFALIQTLELVGGAANLTLLVLNARAGRALSAARRHRADTARTVTSHS